MRPRPWQRLLDLIFPTNYVADVVITHCVHALWLTVVLVLATAWLFVRYVARTAFRWMVAEELERWEW